MLPQQLTLRNFLSYHEATLDFRGLHVACICGSNGAGKSSLLEAIAWAVWGQSRATTEDDLIHLGEREAQVDFLFVSRQCLYRIIRTHQRGQATSLEFQIATGQDFSAPSFRSLTERKLRATQQKILSHLKLDYDTFINSAYLRQGRADEFMLKRPTERKQLLAELLKLDQYDQLAERAKDLARQCKGQAMLLEKNLVGLEAQLEQQAAIAAEQTQLEATIAELQTQQQAETQKCQHLQALQAQRQTWQEKRLWLQEQQQTLYQDRQQLQDQLRAAQRQLQELQALDTQEAQILEGYQTFQDLQAQDDRQNQVFQAYQVAQERRQHLQQQQAHQMQQLQSQLQHQQAQLAALQEQMQQLEQVLARRPEIEAALAQLQQARTALQGLDQLQTQVHPLLQRQQQLQSQFQVQTSRLSARLEELQNTVGNLQIQQSRQPQLQQAVLQVTAQIGHLEKRRIYQQHVQEKGLERRSFMERLQAHQRDYEVQLAHLEQKFELLQQPDATCPLCDRPLDELHWTLVRQKHEQQRQDILDQLWVVREQLAVSEREIQVLRQEYRALEQELSEFTEILERRGQLQEQIQTTGTLSETLERTLAEVIRLERSLQTGDYASELQAELTHLRQALMQLDYDEKNHALARGEVERWRWAEIKQAELKQAERQAARITQQQPVLQEAIKQLQQELNILQNTGPLQQQIQQINQQLAALNYSREVHDRLRTRLRQAQIWQLRYQELRQAQQQSPQVQQRVQELHQLLQQRSQALETVMAQRQTLEKQLAATPDPSAQLQQLEQQIRQRRQRLDQTLGQLGRLQQEQDHLQALRLKLEEEQQQLQISQQQYRIYQELAQAFGKNGIQALMIENVLPQLEQETNQILGRLSANQLHVQFVTQRAGRSSKTKLIDTLDILIADAQGTRSYETYSGGEAFRINFAIRLALARLLAQRCGSDLQMLIIDEGFGTQDAQGCERLIAAINAIAPDFGCILTVTHMPSLKEAFQARIEVTKTRDGSRLSLLV